MTTDFPRLILDHDGGLGGYVEYPTHRDRHEHITQRQWVNIQRRYMEESAPDRFRSDKRESFLDLSDEPGAKRKLSTKHKAVCSMWDKGRDTSEIAIKVGFSEGHVRRVLMIHGKRQFGDQPRSLPALSGREVRILELRSGGATINEIGEAVGLSKSRVHVILRKHVEKGSFGKKSRKAVG